MPAGVFRDACSNESKRRLKANIEAIESFPPKLPGGCRYMMYAPTCSEDFGARRHATAHQQKGRESLEQKHIISVGHAAPADAVAFVSVSGSNFGPVPWAQAAWER